MHLARPACSSHYHTRPTLLESAGSNVQRSARLCLSSHHHWCVPEASRCHAQGAALPALPTMQQAPALLMIPSATQALLRRVLSVQPLQGTATVWLCRRTASLAETRDSCLQALDGDCDGLAGPFDPDCSFWLPSTPAPLPPLLLHLPPPPRRPPPSPPPPMLSGRAPVAVRRPPACVLGSSFCSQLASLANQVRLPPSPFSHTPLAALSPLASIRGVPAPTLPGQSARALIEAHTSAGLALATPVTPPPPPPPH